MAMGCPSSSGCCATAPAAYPPCAPEWSTAAFMFQTPEAGPQRAPARPAEASGNSPEIWKKINLNYSDHDLNPISYLFFTPKLSYPSSRFSPCLASS